MHTDFYARMEFLYQSIIEKLKLLELIVPVVEEKFLTVQETADYLNVSVRTIRRYKKIGIITSTNFGGVVYYALSDLKRFKN